jgi:hypothetical protein
MAQDTWKHLTSQARSLTRGLRPSRVEWVLMIAAELAAITLHLSVVVHVGLTVVIHALLYLRHRLR